MGPTVGGCVRGEQTSGLSAGILTAAAFSSPGSGEGCVRTAKLKTTDIKTTADGRTTITLARGAVALPDPVGPLALALRDRRMATIGGDGWLLAGRKGRQAPDRRSTA